MDAAWEGGKGCFAIAACRKVVGHRQSVPTPILISDLPSLQMPYGCCRQLASGPSNIANAGMHRQIALDAVHLVVGGVCSGSRAGLSATA